MQLFVTSIGLFEVCEHEARLSICATQLMLIANVTIDNVVKRDFECKFSIDDYTMYVIVWSRI